MNEDYIHFNEYAYYNILIIPSYTVEYILHIFCNDKYIIFRKDRINDSDHYNPKNYIIIKKTDSIRINNKPNNNFNDDINFIYGNSHSYYRLYDYYNKDYDLYKLIEKLLNKKDNWIIKSIYIILGSIITKSIDYIISIISK